MEEKISISNLKGQKISTIVHKPQKEGKSPAVILMHGFTGYKEEKHIETLARDLAENGYVAIRFDASGFGESGGTTEEDFRFSNYLKDTASIFEFLKSQNFVDQTRIGIWGHSMGGMLAIIFAAQNPEIKAICSVSAPTTMMGTTDYLRGVINQWKTTGWFEKVTSRDRSKIRIPYAFMEDVQKYNALDFVVKVYQPILFILGKKDDAVLPNDTRKIFEKANKPKQIIEIGRMGHDYKNNLKFIRQVNQRVISFFKENLG